MWIQNSTGLALLQMFSSGEAEARLEPSLLKINCMDLKHPTGCSNCLLSINVTIITKYHKLGGLKEQKCDLTQVWRLEGQDQGVSRAMIPLKALGEDLSLPLSGFRFLPYLGLWTYHSNLCLHYHMVFSLCVSIYSFCKDLFTGLGPS